MIYLLFPSGPRLWLSSQCGGEEGPNETAKTRCCRPSGGSLDIKRTSVRHQKRNNLSAVIKSTRETLNCLESRNRQRNEAGEKAASSIASDKKSTGGTAQNAQRTPVDAAGHELHETTTSAPKLGFKGKINQSVEQYLTDSKSFLGTLRLSTVPDEKDPGTTATATSSGECHKPPHSISRPVQGKGVGW